MRTRFSALLFSLLMVAGCSKSDSAATTTPTPTPTPSATATITPGNSPASTTLISPTPAGSPFADVDVRLRDLEGKMDSIFADTFRNVGGWFNQGTRASSVDLREEKDKYIARLYVPAGDNAKVDAKVENGVLHITAQNSGTVNGKTENERYEQFITLGKPVNDNNVQVEKKNNVVVVTVPKASASAPAVAAASATPAATATASPSESSTDWADQMLAQMNQMQARLDQSIREVFQNDALSTSTSQLGSAMNIEDQKDKYVVHFYLPDKNLSDVNVKFENNQLHLTASEQKKSDAAAGNMESTTVAHYETMTSLPGPVKEAEMKVERKEGSVLVTLPKA
jgi:HSP20 family molecular chaperone IbpA